MRIDSLGLHLPPCTDVVVEREVESSRKLVRSEQLDHVEQVVANPGRFGQLDPCRKRDLIGQLDRQLHEPIGCRSVLRHDRSVPSGLVLATPCHCNGWTGGKWTTHGRNGVGAALDGRASGKPVRAEGMDGILRCLMSRRVDRDYPSPTVPP
jgi:hypothetical protein